jgi:cyclic pyranopterin phosphate synthase
MSQEVTLPSHRSQQQAPSVSAPTDTLGRHLRDLRISVTDRCNFRCVYCMPKEIFGSSYQFLDRKQVLSFEEITRVARIAAELGVRKLRLTGGEPLIRRDLPELIAQLSGLDLIEDIGLTTNGSLLSLEMARALKKAGLERITVSLDSLDDATFMRVNDVKFPVSKVLDAVDNAASAGLTPVKINMVVKGGDNEEEILPMAEHFRGTGHIVRFIEYMDVGASNGWKLDDVVPAAAIADRIGEVYPIEPADPNYGGEVAKRWRYLDGSGEFGIISSVSQPFCRGCTRARISAEGKLYTCLFADAGHDVRAKLRSAISDAEFKQWLSDIWSGRDDRYSELRTEASANARGRIEMSYIGG